MQVCQNYKELNEKLQKIFNQVGISDTTLDDNGILIASDGKFDQFINIAWNRGNEETLGQYKIVKPYVRISEKKVLMDKSRDVREYEEYVNRLCMFIEYFERNQADPIVVARTLN